jgi:hypothetical protein
MIISQILSVKRSELIGIALQGFRRMRDVVYNYNDHAQFIVLIAFDDVRRDG